MAIKDVREYYYTMLNQYLEEKQNLADFEEALRDGFITEEQMQEAMSNVAELEKNYYRLVYIMYLLDIPKGKFKKARYTKKYKEAVEALHKLGADEKAVKDENSAALEHFKLCLEQLKNESKQ